MNGFKMRHCVANAVSHCYQISQSHLMTETSNTLSKATLCFAKVDTEASPKTSVRYRIRSIPTMVLFRQGEEVVRIAGAMSATDIERWLQSHA